MTPFAGCLVVKIGPGELHISVDPEEVIATVLGSCVAACLCDPIARVGGMNHFMLPETQVRGSGSGAWGGDAGRLRYGDFAMDALVEGILKRGGRRERLEAKLFGAASLGPDRGGVGDSNARFAEKFLSAAGVLPIVRRLRGSWAQRLMYHPASGRAFMAEFREASVVPGADQNMPVQLKGKP